jgi:hypothetical protein
VSARTTTIRSRGKVLEERRRALRNEETRIQAEYRVLISDCKHPKAVTTSHMGETCHHCYDCGGCDV